MRDSDRWITPGVIMILILTAGGIVLAVFGAVTYLTVRGYDAAPVVELVGTLVAAGTGVVTLLLQLIQRRGVAKVERNTGVMASEQSALVEALQPGRHAYPDTMYQPPALPPVPERGTAPAAAGRLGA